MSDIAVQVTFLGKLVASLWKGLNIFVKDLDLQLLYMRHFPVANLEYLEWELRILEKTEKTFNLYGCA